MNTISRQLRAKDYISSLAASGRYHFLSSDARKALGVSADAAKLALNRLARRPVGLWLPRGVVLRQGCRGAEQEQDRQRQHGNGAVADTVAHGSDTDPLFHGSASMRHDADCQCSVACNSTHSDRRSSGSSA